METVYYNYYSFEGAKASGGEDHRAVLVREHTPRRKAVSGNNVISLEDYRARHAAPVAEQAAFAAEAPEEVEPSCGRGAERAAARSRRREKLLMGMELAACAAIIAVAASACLVFLL